jgi:uncharacterized protein YacL
MKKVFFTNKIFYFLLTSYILLLVIYNAYSTIKHSNAYGVIPISIQSVLLILIWAKNKYTRQFILIWAIIFLIMACGLEIIGNLMGDFGNNFEGSKFDELIYNLITLYIGFLIAYYSKTIVILNSNKDVN